MINKQILFSITVFLFLSPLAKAAGGNFFGIYAATGLPYASQYGLSYVNSSKSFSVDLSYNTISVDSGLASASLTKPELNLKWHPFAGAFYLGLGLGQMSLTAEATDAATSQAVKVEVTSTTITPNIGWMWGVGDGGFYAGIDFGYQSPSGPETTLTTSLPSSNQAYIDAVKQGNDLGETAIPLFTLLRLGYLF